MFNKTNELDLSQFKAVVLPSNNGKLFKPADHFWAKVVQLVQLAMLTQTDVVDYFRQVTLVETSEGSLVPSPEYEAIYEIQIEELTQRLENLMQSQQDISKHPDLIG